MSNELPIERGVAGSGDGGTLTRLGVGKGNEEQAAAWDGKEGEEWAKHADFYERTALQHNERLLEAAGIAREDRVLDIGCGTGGTTRDAARAAPAGTAVGIDLSSRMLEVARSRAADEGLYNVTFVHGDAQVYPFETASFDVAISNFGSMFFADQVGAFTNVARSLRPGGRVVVLSWQAPARNEWLMSFFDALTLGKPFSPPPSEAPTPFRHALPDVMETILTEAGFTDVAFEDVEAPMFFGSDADEGFGVLSETLAWVMGNLEGEDRAKALDNLRATLSAHESPDGVAYASAAWLYTATR